MAVESHIKTYMLNTWVITENAKLRKIKHHKLVFSGCCLSPVVFCLLLCSLGQFSPWSRFWSNHIQITSFNRRILVSLAITVFRLVCCHLNSLYLSVVTNFTGMDVSQFKAYVMCTATIDRDKYPVCQAVTALHTLYSFIAIQIGV
jgi:hypothetical protein